MTGHSFTSGIYEDNSDSDWRQTHDMESCLHLHGHQGERMEDSLEIATETLVP